MHDYFEILGVSPDARATDIRRACRRHAPATHPDFRQEDESAPGSAPRVDGNARTEEFADVAVDFVEMGAVVGRMQQAFFGTTRSRGW